MRKQHKIRYRGARDYFSKRDFEEFILACEDRKNPMLKEYISAYKQIIINILREMHKQLKEHQKKAKALLQNLVIAAHFKEFFKESYCVRSRNHFVYLLNVNSDFILNFSVYHSHVKIDIEVLSKKDEEYNEIRYSLIEVLDRIVAKKHFAYIANKSDLCLDEGKKSIMRKFTLYWKSGKKEIVEGKTALIAFKSAGHDISTANDLEFFAFGEDDSYKWNDSAKVWEK